MLSDGQVLNRPLHKMSCQNCGHGFHSVPPTPKELRGFFDMSYSLGQRNPSAEARRAEFYAEAIADFLAAHGIAWPERLIELGCGMGSLLSELSRRWSCRLAVGLEPSQQLVDAARVNCSVEVEIFQGFAEDLPLPDVSDCDICLSVNVAEHTLSPSGFLSICRSTIREGGRVVVICPDGEQPSSELL